MKNETHFPFSSALTIRFLISVFLGSFPNARATETTSPVPGNTAFALDLYAQLKSQPGNLFFSPYSISTALAIAYAGARGDTAVQMARVLHFRDDQASVHSAFGLLQRQLAESGTRPGIELSVANVLWAQKGYPFLPEFLNVARTEYQANLNQADFETAADSAREEINRWVALKTKGKIQDILPPGSVDNKTSLVLANAIYFKGVWVNKFQKAWTKDKPFHLSHGAEVDAPLMYRQDEVGYMVDRNFQAVELPYQGNALSMVILLPRTRDSCGDLETILKPDLISRTLRQLRKQKVEIFLPRFKVQSSLRLNDTLLKMDMPDAFGPSADFSGMNKDRMLCLSDVFHKAWAEVNEEGTKAAAVTVWGLTLSARPPLPPPPVFLADHPFIFFIRDSRCGILFLGRLADPSR